MHRPGVELTIYGQSLARVKNEGTATPKGRNVVYRKSPFESPKNFNREHLKFGLKFSMLTRIISGLVRISLSNFSRPCGELMAHKEKVTV